METERLQKLVSGFEKDKVAGRVFNVVLSHIDPDSIGSGFGMRHFLRRLGIPNARLRIIYSGEAGGEQNRMIIDRYSLMTHMLPLERFWPDGSKDSYDNSNDVYIFVDSSSPDDKRLSVAAGKINPIAVIDHHKNPAPEENENNFVWLANVGACSTMIVELLEQAGLLSFSKEAGDDLFVPVLLALGIRSDTHGLVANITSDDLDAYAKVYNLCNKEDLRSLIQIPKSKAYVAVEDYARAHRIQSGLRLVSCAGYVGNNSVYVAEIANEMANWLGVSVAVVFGMTDDRSIVFSIRSTDITLHSPLSRTMEKEFGNGCGVKRSDDGRYLEGGGKYSIGMNLAQNWKNRDKFFEVVIEHFQNIFLSDELQ